MYLQDSGTGEQEPRLSSRGQCTGASQEQGIGGGSVQGPVRNRELVGSGEGCEQELLASWYDGAELGAGEKFRDEG